MGIKHQNEILFVSDAIEESSHIFHIVRKLYEERYGNIPLGRSRKKKRSKVVIDANLVGYYQERNINNNRD